MSFVRKIHPVLWTGIAAAATAAVTLACADASRQAPGDIAFAAGPTPPNVPADYRQQLVALRQATVAFQDPGRAAQAGYDTPITNCWYFTGMGGMGFHYADTHLIDGTVDLLKPEAVMYEPKAGGGLRMVGFEYLVPVDQWQGSAPPTLLGQTFGRNDGLGLYFLHLWLWRDNPAEHHIFADWNPRVSCDNTADKTDLSAN